jgi:putative nucleotidyltransferase with HDIG domain
MSAIESILKDIDRLKPIPQVANKILAIIQNPDSAMADLSEIIVHDVAVTANLLKVANSAYFGLPRKFESAHQAIVFLGMDQVVDLVLMSSSSDNLKTAQEGYGLDAGELWRYSVSSALIARELAERKAIGDAHLVFTAALLKDIGKVVLSQYVADSFEKINALVTDRGHTFREAEKEVIGIDHSELGGLVAKAWQFSPMMVEIIRNHHVPQDATMAQTEAYIVYLADTLCMMMGIGVGSDGLAYRFHKDAVKFLDLTERDFQEIMSSFGEKLQEVEDLMQNA